MAEGKSGADLKLVAADPELLNIVLTALQLMISLIVRLNNPNQQGDHFDGIKAGILKRAFDIIHLRFFNPNPTPHAKEVADRLRQDVRVIFFLSLLLRDITQLSLKRESWLWFYRRPIFLSMLTDVARASVKLADNPAVARNDLFAEPREAGTLGQVVKTLVGGGQGWSPFTEEKKNCTTGRIFENVFIAMRSLLLASCHKVRMKPPEDEAFYLPEGSMYPHWDWRSQDVIPLHREAASWVSRMIQMHNHYLPAVLEGVRYIGAIASMRNLEGVTEQMVAERTQVEGLKPLVELFDINNPELILVIVSALQRTTHVECQVIAACIAGNFINYQRPAINAFNAESAKNVDGMADVLTGCLSLSQRATALKDPLRSSCILYTLRATTTFLTLEAPKLIQRVLQGNVLQQLQRTFTTLYGERHNTLSPEDYAYILHGYSVILRNLATIGVQAILATLGNDPGTNQFKSDPLTDAIEDNLGFAPLIGLFLEAIYKLNDAPFALGNSNQLLAEMRENLLETLKTLLRYEQERKEICGYVRIEWEKVDKIKLESQLIVIHEEWVAETAGREGAVSERFVLLLYMLTSLSFSFMRKELPDLLAGVAYRPDMIASDRIKDICAAASALLSATQGSSKTSGTMKELLTKVAGFLQHAALIKDERQKLWHYRMAVGWTQIPNVIKQIVEDELSLNFVFDTLSERSFCRYSILAVHNLSVFASLELLKTAGKITALCDCYRRLMLEPSFLPRQKERPLLTRWLMASMRSILFSPQKISDEPPFDRDFYAFLELAPVVDNFDAGLYINTLLRMSDEWLPSRNMILFSPAASKIFEALLRPGKFSLSPVEVLPYNFDPKAMKPDDPNAIKLVEKKKEAGLGKKKGLWHAQQKAEAEESRTAKEAQGIGSGKDAMVGFVREYVLFMASHMLMNMCWPPATKLTPEQEASLFPWERAEADKEKQKHEERVTSLATESEAVSTFIALVDHQCSAHQQKKVRRE